MIAWPSTLDVTGLLKGFNENVIVQIEMIGDIVKLNPTKPNQNQGKPNIT